MDQAQNRPVPTEFEELLESIRSTRDQYDDYGSLEDCMEDEFLSERGDIKALVSTQCAAWVLKAQHYCSQQSAHVPCLSVI